MPWFLYKNTLYKNTEAQFAKNKSRQCSVLDEKLNKVKKCDFFENAQSDSLIKFFTTT